MMTGDSGLRKEQKTDKKATGPTQGGKPSTPIWDSQTSWQSFRRSRCKLKRREIGSDFVFSSLNITPSSKILGAMTSLFSAHQISRVKSPARGAPANGSGPGLEGLLTHRKHGMADRARNPSGLPLRYIPWSTKKSWCMCERETERARNSAPVAQLLGLRSPF